MSIVGAGFVVGIHMTALWFKPKDIGFAEGFYAGWGNFGSAAAAITIPTIALQFFGGVDGWRWAIALSGLIMAVYGVAYWFLITDGPTADTHKSTFGWRFRGIDLERPFIILFVYCSFIRCIIITGLSYSRNGLFERYWRLGMLWRYRVDGAVSNL